MRTTTFSVVLLALVAPTTASAGLADGPPLSVPREQLAAALHCSGDLRSTDRNPVLLVHGTTQTADESWGWNYQRVLPRMGYPTCGVDLPNRALTDMQVASEYVVFAIRAMSTATGRDVEVIGHSQGGEEPRWAIKWWPDIRTKVDHYIGLAAPDHGDANFDGMCARMCWASAWQERPGAKFMHALNEGDETPGDVAYTSIYTVTDQFVQPEVLTPTSGLDGGRAIALQDVCPGRVVDHLGIIPDAVTFALVIDALTHPGETSDPARIDPAVCVQRQMPGVTAMDELAYNLNLYTVTIPAAFQSHQVDAEPPLAAYATRNEE